MTVTTQLWLFTVCSTVSSSSSTVQLITEKLWDSHHSVESKRSKNIWFPNTNDIQEPPKASVLEERSISSLRQQLSSESEEPPLQTLSHRWNFFQNTLHLFDLKPLHIYDLFTTSHQDVRSANGSSWGQGLMDVLESINEINELTKREIEIDHSYHRLPDLLEPMHYTLALKVYHWGNRTFSGRVSIAVRAKEDSSVVFLHCSKLNIFWDSVQVIDSSGTRQHRVVDHKILPGPEMIALVVRPRLIKDVAYNISIEFSGVMAEDEYGLYSLSYSNNGDTHYMALTQLQTTYGRQVFPCLDEPALKARFSLRVARPTNCTALSNTRRISTTLIEPGWVWDEFETTPLISTYILAFAVIDFDYLTVTGPGITFSVWTRPDLLPFASYVLEIVPQLLYYYQDYFKVKYPLGKLDIVAVPSVYPRAMENIGLISMHERMVQRTPSSRTQDRVVTTKIVAHELAHMWLGNLVTPAWWDHIWLSEGFATFFAAQATSLIIPDGYVEGSFVAHEHWLSLATDVAPMSRAIYVPVLSNQTLLVFDDHTYNKGACLVRMMQFFMGEMNFRRSVSTYIKTRQFSTSTNWDLLSVLGDTNTVRERLPESVELSEVMRGWLTIVGYPLITITRLSNGTARLEQVTVAWRK
ncbi:thyrotropin-releasing hormone-degrading ectoenzyme [Hyalella azteca]|uniref:Thyrotropin-releasing hormone-degrading ectoenzyme n=1 Tax=Hyalella azteca TaxID=294128 RepID=A0A8B7PGG3_HYAAZ|nr:thyrotropin-releasing hormone-degrading ectoenzyme [Hyalella azteca]